MDGEAVEEEDAHDEEDVEEAERADLEGFVISQNGLIVTFTIMRDHATYPLTL